MYLKRVSFTPMETFGVLLEWKGGVPFALTLEDPWRNNESNISCIPAGRYICMKVKSPTFGDTYEITNVPNRTHILFHAGNTHKDTQGCILVGKSYGYLGSTPAVLESTTAMREFMIKVVGLPQFELEIE
jgi:hypothetical protein